METSTPNPKPETRLRRLVNHYSVKAEYTQSAIAFIGLICGLLCALYFALIEQSFIESLLIFIVSMAGWATIQVISNISNTLKEINKKMS